jgi:hypothetical protein
MELLKKTIKNKEEKRGDNADKKELLAKGRHPQSAKQYREEWSFIEYEPARDNISYQLQYLEYMVHLYNDYKMYLTIESLHCKNMLITLASIMECALFDLLYQESQKKSGIGIDVREDFLLLIDQSFKRGLIDGNMKHLLHELRKVRNFVHISSLEQKEYAAYTIEQVNQYLTILNNFQKRIMEKFIKK